jgi:hypothetical protein
MTHAMSWFRVSLALSQISLSYLNMRWCLTLGEMILPILH